MALNSANHTIDWDRVKDLFAKAEALPSEARRAWLEVECHGDVGILDEVVGLLQSLDGADASDYLSESALSRKRPANAYITDGSMIGPWQLGGVIGQGGMGTVYQAHRADGAYDRSVALKFLRVSGVLEKARFQAEAKILARLEHPHIARLYDAAIVNDIPYLAIALIEGESITEYVKSRKLSHRDSIEIFLQVADAITYAHRNLIVHRDIKPSNILVDESGAAFLLDFGIARTIGTDGIEATQTLPGNSALTLAYAAPEQIRMQPITTSTDIYSLGVVLFEMLAGQRAYEIAGKGLKDIEQIVCEIVPDSLASVAPKGAGLKGDVDTIVMKAIAKKPEERYESVSAFTSDLHRYLDGLPIEARPPTSIYRFKKFVRRNRGYVTAAGIALLALFSGLSIAIWQGQLATIERDRAQRRFESAREMAGEALFDIHDAVSEVPGSTSVRELIVAKSLSYLEQLAAEAGNDNLLRLDLANAYLRTGNVLGNPNNANLGRLQPALDSYDRGLAILPLIAKGDSIADLANRSRAVINERRAEVFAALGQMDSVEVVLKRSNSYLTALADENPNRADALVDLAISHIKTGDLLGNPNFPNAGRLDDAIRHYYTALLVLDRADRLVPDSDTHLRERGLVHERLGAVQFASNRADDALANYQESFDIRRKLYDENPTQQNTLRDLGVAHEKLALVFQHKRELKRAHHEFEQALAILLDLSKADREDVQAQRSLAIEYLHMAELMYSIQLPNMGRKKESRKYALLAKQLLIANGSPDPNDSRLAEIVEWADRLLN